jgi:raffinose/stachyose/melibiose transport system substrate-binding protein
MLSALYYEKEGVMLKQRVPFVLCLSLLLVLSGFAPSVHSQDEPITLLLWDTYDENNTDKAGIVEAIIARFEEDHPNVDIVREVQSFDNMKPLINTALASGTGPDIVLYGTGAGFMGPLVDANLLLPLDDYVEQYGWRDRIYPWTWDSATFNGQVFAIGHELEMIGVYYNKDIFAELGLEVPTTYEEFLAVCEAVKEAGYIPLAFANQPGWPAYHLFSSFTNVLEGKEGMDELFAGERPWTDEAVVQAIQMAFVDLNDAEYFIPSPNAITYEEGNVLFYTGVAAMHHTGMWLYGEIITNSDFEVGFFALPAIGDMPSLPPGGMGSGLMLSAATEHPDEAAAFMDLFFSEEFAQLWYEEGNTIPPLDVDPAQFDLEPLFLSFAQTIRESSTGGGGLGYNIDVLTPPDFNTVMNEGFQAVLNGDRTPAEQAEALQAAWDAFYTE